MGFCRDDAPGHEGFAVGFVELEPGSRLFRELAYPEKTERPVVQLSAGCECGWRSSRFLPIQMARWSPYIVLAGERDEEMIRRLWLQHVTDEVRT